MDVQRVVLAGRFGSFRRPSSTDTDYGYTSFQFPPLPTLMGLLGAMTGKGGYRTTTEGAYPEFYETYRDFMIGLEPLAVPNDNGGRYLPVTPDAFTTRSDPFNVFGSRYNHQFQTQTTDKYHKRYYSDMGNIREEVLLWPAFRLHLGGDSAVLDELVNHLPPNEAVHPPYFGKNEFPVTVYNDGRSTYEPYEGDETPVCSLVDSTDGDWSIDEMLGEDSVYTISDYAVGFHENLQYDRTSVAFSPDACLELHDSHSIYRDPDRGEAVGFLQVD